ncbi:MAG: hypothetical protein MK171_04520 [Pirellulales bacterium]|nr:hypothetical protein [Pirellulales bacterium]
MLTTATPASPVFIDRRQASNPDRTVGRERRQFTNSHDSLSPEATALAEAIDLYKLQHRRRFINYEEMLAIFKSLGYTRS